MEGEDNYYFWEGIKELLFKARKAGIDNNNLTSTMKQGIKSLLPKPGKDKRHIVNLGPNLYSMLIINCSHILLPSAK